MSGVADWGSGMAVERCFEEMEHPALMVRDRGVGYLDRRSAMGSLEARPSYRAADLAIAMPEHGVAAIFAQYSSTDRPTVPSRPSSGATPRGR